MADDELTSALEQITKLLLEDEDSDSFLQRVVEIATDVIDGADEVSLTIVTNERAETMASTGETALALDECQYEIGRGPCVEAAIGHEVLVISDITTEDRWSDYLPAAVRAGVASSMSVPLPIDGEILGAVNVYARRPHAFDHAAASQARQVAALVGVSLASVRRYSTVADKARNLERAMASRAVIEQAKGIIMARSGCDAERAFDVLVRASQNRNEKLRSIARHIVETRGRPSQGPK